MKTLYLESDFFEVKNIDSKYIISYHSKKGVGNYLLFGAVCALFFILLLTPYVRQFVSGFHHTFLLSVFGLGVLFAGIMPIINIYRKKHELIMDYANNKLVSNGKLIHFSDIKGLRMIRQEVEVSDQGYATDSNLDSSFETVDVVGIEIQYSEPLRKLMLMNLMTWEWKSWDLLFNFLNEMVESKSLPGYRGKMKRKDKSPYPDQNVHYIAFGQRFNEYQRGSIKLKKAKWIDPIHDWRQTGREDSLQL